MRMFVKQWSAVLIAVSAVSFLTRPATAKVTADYTVTKTVSIGSPDRWDYLHFDPVSQRLYVAHGNSLTVINGRDGTVIGKMTDMPGGSHGIGIVHSTGTGYTDDGRNGTVIAFSLKTLKPLKTIKALPDADGIIFDKYSGHVFVIDGDSEKVTVIDPKMNKVIATVDGGGALEFGVSGENGKLYVDGAEKNEIVRIDTSINKADAHWPLRDCVSPHGIAIDRATNRLFISCRNARLDVVDEKNGKNIVSLPIGHGTDAAGFDPVRHLIFSSNFDGTLSVISEDGKDKYSLRQTVKTAIGARTMALDPRMGRIYLATADYTINEPAKPSDFRHRYKLKKGSAKILFFDVKNK